MIELRDWIRSTTFAGRPWLILGKGPSFSRHREFPLRDFNLLGLNDVAREIKVDVAHAIDTEVIRRCGDALAHNCEYLLMPRRPHVEFRSTDRLLEAFFDDLPVLRELDSRGRLVWYNALSGTPVGSSPVMRVRRFGSEAAVDILGEMGVQQIRTLGVDGRRNYGDDFDDLSDLGNGRPSFDAQFRGIEEIVAARGMDFDPLIEPMRVYVGVDESQLVAARVLEHSIRKHASRPVRFIPIPNLHTPTPKDPQNRGRTGFSFSRFHIPKLAGYRGRALYLDADMQVFTDLAEIWDIPFGRYKLICTRQDHPPPAWEDNSWFHPGRQMSVMLLDCEHLDWKIENIIGGLDDGRYSYSNLLFDMCVVPDAEIGDHLDPAWNSLETYEAGRTKLLHYTAVPTQPWKNDENPLRELWEEDFVEALAAGMIYPYELRRSIRAGFVKPSLGGLPPRGLPAKVVSRLTAKAERTVLPVERHFAMLQKPGYSKIRKALGRY